LIQVLDRPLSLELSDKKVNAPTDRGLVVGLLALTCGVEGAVGVWGRACCPGHGRNVKRFRGGLVFKAHRLLYHETKRLVSSALLLSSLELSDTKGYGS